jgi:hypothetical protein
MELNSQCQSGSGSSKTSKDVSSIRPSYWSIAIILVGGHSSLKQFGGRNVLKVSTKERLQFVRRHYF